MSSQTATRVSSISRSSATAFGVLAAISFCHFLNDLLQSVIPAVYPILKTAYRLDFKQIGLITLSVQLTASLLQPFVGIYPTIGQLRIRCRWGWDSRFPVYCFWRLRRASA